MNLQHLEPEQLLERASALAKGRIALATSFSIEDQILTHMICATHLPISIFTLDTGRLPQETYEVMHATMKKYRVHIEVIFPNKEDVEPMTVKYGPNLFYESLHKRKLCCFVRKVKPLKERLSTLDVWLCGLRNEQSLTRNNISIVEHDQINELIKINPLAQWSIQRVWDYIKKNNIPFNTLYNKNYLSIGCAPCTRPVSPGENIRDGRWWWEKSIHKECGLHSKNSQRKLSP